MIYDDVSEAGKIGAYEYSVKACDAVLSVDMG